MVPPRVPELVRAAPGPTAGAVVAKKGLSQILSSSTSLFQRQRNKQKQTEPTAVFRYSKHQEETDTAQTDNNHTDAKSDKLVGESTDAPEQTEKSSLLNCDKNAAADVGVNCDTTKTSDTGLDSLTQTKGASNSLGTGSAFETSSNSSSSNCLSNFASQTHTDGKADKSNLDKRTDCDLKGKGLSEASASAAPLISVSAVSNSTSTNLQLKNTKRDSMTSIDRMFMDEMSEKDIATILEDSSKVHKVRVGLCVR